MYKVNLLKKLSGILYSDNKVVVDLKKVKSNLKKWHILLTTSVLNVN